MTAFALNGHTAAMIWANNSTCFAKIAFASSVVAVFLATPVLAAGASGSHLVTEKELAVSGTVWVMSMIGVATSTWAIATIRNKDRSDMHDLRADMDRNARITEQMQRDIATIRDSLEKRT